MTNHYLTGIAGRNNSDNNFSLIPLMTPQIPQLNHLAESDGFEEVIQQQEAILSRDPGGKQGEKLNEKRVEFSDPPFPLQNRMIMTGSVIEPSANTERINYISRHTERIYYPEKIIEYSPENPSLIKFNREDITDPDTSKESEPDKAKKKPVLKVLSKEEKTFIDGKIIVQEEKQPMILDDRKNLPKARETSPFTISPYVPDPPRRDQPVRGIREIMPNMPDLSSTDQKMTNVPPKSGAQPKLVIGKITVEIIPPPANLPQKVITRVIGKTSEENQPKTNRLSFGLGQM